MNDRPRSLSLLLVAILSLHAPTVLADCALPDLPACACHVAGGQWPLVGVSGDLIATARKSAPLFPMKTSCLRHRGQPYWQVQLQNDSPDWSHFVAHWLSGVATKHPPEAWCTETVAFWHREAQLPWPNGYATVWWPSTFVKNVADLRLWYQTEESGLLAFFGYEGRGHWVGGSELDYDDFQPGVNAPCPGAYQAWEAYGAVSQAWEDSCFHSQVIDSMVVHRFGDVDGPVIGVDLHIIEGNAPNGSFLDINGVSVNRGTVRNTNWVRNVIDWTSLGDSSNSCGLTRQKIRGWGIDHDASGNPICDLGKIETIVDQTFLVHATPTGPDEPDSQMVNRLVNYFASSSGGSKSVTTNAGSIQTGGAMPTPTNPWHVPAGPLGVDPAYIEVDLLAEHPVPVSGVVVEWKDGFAPLQHEVWWAGQDQQAHVSTVSLASGLTPPTGGGVAPIPTKFGPATNYPVRYLRLVLPAASLTRPFDVVGLHYLFDYGKEDDNGDVLGEDETVDAGPPIGARAGIRILAVRPNPSSMSASIEFEYDGAEVVELRVFDVAGRRVARIAGAPSGPGIRRLVWDGRDRNGLAVPNGSYFLELAAGNAKSARKIFVVR